jgi:hypothetical protein
MVSKISFNVYSELQIPRNQYELSSRHMAKDTKTKSVVPRGAPEIGETTIPQL